MAIAQPKLKYAEDALKPYLSERTVSIHYNKHTTKYFDTMNKLIKGTPFDKEEDLTKLVSKDALMKADSKLFNNACQAWNHTFFWSCLTPTDQSGSPSELLMSAIVDTFGTFEVFKKKFSEQANNHFASGWAWLVLHHNALIIKTTPNAGTPLTSAGMIPLLCFDLWEHSYLYQEAYAADRPAYVEALWNIINWTFVSNNYEDAIKS